MICIVWVPGHLRVQGELSHRPPLGLGPCGGGRGGPLSCWKQLAFLEQKLSGSHKALVEMQDVVAELLKTVPREYPDTKVSGERGPAGCRHPVCHRSREGTPQAALSLPPSTQGLLCFSISLLFPWGFLQQ